MVLQKAGIAKKHWKFIKEK